MERLIVATNVNDILARTLATGRYEVEKVVPTISPSMDIQVSSNFERLLFDAYDRDAEAVCRLMQSLSQSGAFTVDKPALETMRGTFGAARVDEEETARTIRETWTETGELVDPHSAVGLGAAKRERGSASVPMVTLATAHPAKFPDAVEKAVGLRPALPESMADLFEREERLDALPNDLGAVQAFIRDKARSFSAKENDPDFKKRADSPDQTKPKTVSSDQGLL